MHEMMTSMVAMRLRKRHCEPIMMVEGARVQPSAVAVAHAHCPAVRQ